MKAWIYWVLFLALNFGGLYIGSLYTTSGVNSVWYSALPKAPWTPPGWFFGFAWTTIMLAYSFYLTIVYMRIKGDAVAFMLLFALQWVLQVAWNPVFFGAHQTITALILLVALTLVIGFQLNIYRKLAMRYSFLILPYFLWLIVATSLNAFIVVNTAW